jgi:hypothetical protein
MPDLNCAAAQNLGYCNYKTGSCLCQGTAYGEQCQWLSCPGNCTYKFGGGVCNRETGVCKCNAGRLLEDCTGVACPGSTPTLDVVLTTAPEVGESCFVPHDEHDGTLEALGFDCIQGGPPTPVGFQLCAIAHAGALPPGAYPFAEMCRCAN